MLNWKKQCSNIHGFNGLYEEMTSGNGLYILDDVQLPDTCGHAVCTIEFRYYDEHHVSIRCVDAPVNYSGSCPQIGRWLSSGTADFDSFDNMKDFLLKFLKNTATTYGEGIGILQLIISIFKFQLVNLLIF